MKDKNEIIIDKNNSLIEVYFKILKEQQEKWGPNTLLFFQVGSFFEMYALENTEYTYLFKEVSEKLNLQITKRNKSIKEISMKNPLMAGIPTVAFERYIYNLQKENKYTMVVVEQVTEPPNPVRKITKVISPSTNIDTTEDNNILMVINLQNEDIKNSINPNKLSAGITIGNLITGKIKITEIYTLNDIKSFWKELEYFIEKYAPSELVILLNDFQITKEELYINLGLKNNILLHIKDITNSKIKKVNYKNKLIDSIYNNNTFLTGLEFLDLERYLYAQDSFIYFLKFVYEHNPILLEKIDKPVFIEENKILQLQNHSILQLNVISMDNSPSLLKILNKTSTAIGRRYFQEKLLNPLIEPEEIKNIYHDTNQILYKNNKKTKEIYKEIENYLNEVYDIERLHRKLTIKKLNPAEFLQLDISYNALIKLKEVLFNKYILKFKNIDNNENLWNELGEYINEYNRIFNLDIMGKYNLNDIEENIFNKGIYKDIDQIVEEIEVLKDNLNKVVEQLNTYVSEPAFRLEKTEKEGYYIYITNARFKEFEKNKNNIKLKILDKELEYKDLIIKKLTNNRKIFIEELSHINDKLLVLQQKLIKKVKEEYLLTLENFYFKYKKLFKELTNFVAYIDYIKTNAKNAYEYNYVEPTISNEQETSFVQIKGLRHPIIERINIETYIPNDVILGKNNTDGILLYGVNASGKSSLMKSLGIAIIMAQAGLFVAADKMIYKPFRKIFTRISDMDNIYKGLSSFAVEMSELRQILKYSDNNTLVLGDEISHGTENISATAIVGSAIYKLAKNNVKFLFSTHLHNVAELNKIKELKNLKFFHLEVRYDEKTGKLVYDRKLKEGIGPTIYGLEVAKAMDLDKEFLKIAYEIRNEIINDTEKTSSDYLLNEEYKESKYNKNVIIDKCYFCNKKAEHVHHIIPQKNFLNGQKIKNLPGNLLPVCEKHHEDIHKGKIIIKGWKKTTDGIKLDYEIKK